MISHTNEHIVLVDEHDREIGTEEKIAAHEKALLHRAFSVFLLSVDPAGNPVTLLQQRCQSKYHCGGLWTNSCCSHPRAGETVLAAASRRLAEELTITEALPLEQVGSFIYRADFDNGLTEHEFDHVVIAKVPYSLTMAPVAGEVMATRWVGLAELNAELQQHPEQFTPWFAKALELTIAHWPHKD